MILLSYTLVFGSLLGLIFTYYGSVFLIISCLLCVGILIYFFKLKLKWISRILVIIPLLLLTSFNLMNLKNLKSSNTEVETIMIGDMKREYRHFIPENFNVSSHKTAIIALHGFKQSAKGMERLTGFSELASAHNFMVIYPEGYKKGWNDGDDTKEATKENIDDISFLSFIIDWAKEKGANNIILAGFSNGGFLAVNAGCKLSHKLDAVVPVAAGTWNGNLMNCSNVSKHDILFIQCQADKITNYSRFGPSVITYAQKTGCTPGITLIQEEEENWTLKEYQCSNNRVMHLYHFRWRTYLARWSAILTKFFDR